MRESTTTRRAAIPQDTTVTTPSFTECQARAAAAQIHDSVCQACARGETDAQIIAAIQAGGLPFDQQQRLAIILGFAKQGC